jgi:ABC-type phosphate transport system substrate-binding protein
MTGLSARRLATALAVSSASAVAFMVPGAATASAAAQIKGQGSTLQEIAQQTIFKPAFNKLGEGEVTEYKGTGSGAGLEAWGNGHVAEYNTWEYVGTDQPPNPTQKKAIEEKAGGATVLSIPTVQAAVAIIIHLPTGCTSVSSKAKKETTHLALNDKTVEEIFAHKITKWSEIKDDSDKLNPAGCAGETPITRVVRTEGSGTTAITKKWFFQINDEPVDGTKTWNALAEENKNLNWPAETEDLARGAGSGGIVTTVAADAGSIGYVNLANAYEGKFGKAGVDSWAVVENKAGKKPTYANPEKLGAKIAKSHPKAYAEGESNCAGTEYVNGVGAKFPPKTTEEAWNEVSSKPSEPNYPICGFTYDLSLTNFSDIEPSLQPTGEQVEVVEKYFKFMVAEGPKLLVNGTDYLALPENVSEEKSVFDIAKKGTEKIS